MKKLTLTLLVFTVCIAASQTLVFKSGFEPNTQGLPPTDHKDITGVDNSTGYSWTQDLEDHPKIGDFFFDYTGGDYKGRFGKIIDEPGNESNKILQFWCNTPNASNGNARVQNNLYGNKNLKEFYQKIRMYVHPDLEELKKPIAGWTFFTIAEFWNNANWVGEDFPFRVSLNFYKRTGVKKPFGFYAHAQTDLRTKWREEWQAFDEWEIPFGKWLTCELYIKEGDSNNGRFYFAVTPEDGKKEVIFDITDLTHHPDDPAPNGFGHWNPMKLYTSKKRVEEVLQYGKVLQLYWDDWELWEGGMPETVEENGSAPPEEYSLKQNYPNPFNPSTTIEFSLPEASAVDLSVYDITGRKIETLINGYRESGTYQVNWSGLTQPAGIYLCTLKAGDFVHTRKLIFAK